MHACISVSIPKNLLSHIDANIKGKSRNEKVSKCVAEGFKKLTEK